nr:MAG TPA: hypothetical protein [Caudoviricetes sp.]
MQSTICQLLQKLAHSPKIKKPHYMGLFVSYV